MGRHQSGPFVWLASGRESRVISLATQVALGIIWRWTMWPPCRRELEHLFADTQIARAARYTLWQKQSHSFSTIDRLKPEENNSLGWKGRRIGRYFGSPLMIDVQTLAPCPRQLQAS